MDEVNHAVLDNLREFFSRVDSARNSVSPIEEPHSDPIDVKDFITLCNLCEAQSKYSSSRDCAARALGNAVVSLNQLDRGELDAMESALKEGRWDEWCKDSGKKASADDATFYLVLKHHTDAQQHYHFHFDKDMVAEIDAFDPFIKEGGKKVLNQQWHALISLLAFLDVAHALSNEQHEYHCLYQYIKKLDKIDFNADELKFYCGTSGKTELRFYTKEGKLIEKYPSEKMNEWLEEALRKLAGK